MFRTPANNSAVNPTVIEQNLFKDNTAAGPNSGTGIYADQFTAGIRLVYEEFVKALASQGVQRIEPKIGEEFTPGRHEAVMSRTDHRDVAAHGDSVGSFRVAIRG